MKSHSNVHALSDQEIAKLIAEVDHIATLVGEGFEPLKPKEINRLLKLNAKRRSVLPLIARLAGEYGVGSPSSPIAQVNEKLATADRIRPLLARVAGLHKVLFDVTLTLEDEAWKGGSANYAMLRAEARSNAVLAHAIVPIRDALRTRTPAQRASSSDGAATRPAPSKQAAAPNPPSHTPAGA